MLAQPVTTRPRASGDGLIFRQYNTSRFDGTFSDENSNCFMLEATTGLHQVEEFHPPEIIDALFRGLFVRPGEIATHCAAMLAFVHGKAESSFDWDKRPLFLKFNSDDDAERRRAFDELCALLELEPAAVMERIGE